MDIKQLADNFFRPYDFEEMLIFSLVLSCIFLVYLVWYVLEKLGWIPYSMDIDIDLNLPIRNKFMHSFFGEIGEAIEKVIDGTFIILVPRWYKVLIIGIPIGLFLGVFSYHYFFTRPWVVYQNPNPASVWVDQTEPITVVFNKPVDKDRLEFNISSGTPGDIEWIPSFAGMPDFLTTYRAMRFYPSQTILPDDKIIVYLVGIESITGVDGVHEHNMEFTPPQTPEINTASIKAGEENVATDAPIRLNFSNANGSFVEWEISVDPEVPFSLDKSDPQNWWLTFDEELEQETKYAITAERTIVEKSIATGEILSSFDTETAFELEFTTVTAPNLKGVSMKGKNVLPNKALVINFDEPMNTASVEANLLIEPVIVGEFTWDEAGQKMTFTPESGLWAKDTQYTITVDEGALSALGGEIKKSIKHKFTTVGEVKIVKSDPKGGKSNVEINRNLMIEFNQPVVRKSAQRKFSISPNVGGNFKWVSDRKLRYELTQKMQYERTYTVSFAKGLKAKFGKDTTSDLSFRFTTQSETFILNVPWYSQEERFTCNVASTRMVLAYRGIYLSESAIKSGMGIGPSLSGSTGGNPYTEWIDGYGTYWTNVSDYISSNYRSTAVRRNWNTADMLAEVRNGNPVILWWQNAWSDWYRKSWTTPGGQTIEGLNGMHSEIVIGYKGSPTSPDTIITRDPWRNTRYYSKSYFENLWQDSFSKTAVVVY